MTSPVSRLLPLLVLALTPLGVIAASTLAPAPVYADDIGTQVLRAIDQQAAAFTDQSYTAEMKIFRGGSLKKTVAFDMKMKGLEKQYIEFTAPGDVAGMKILMVGEEMWMYSPEFAKVRRIAAHTESQGFLGSEFTAEDMALTKLSGNFEATVTGKQGNLTTLELLPKPGREISHSKLVVVVDKSKGGVTSIEYYDSSGNHVRTQERRGWTKIEGKAFPTEIAMKNLKSGNETVIKLSDVKVNQGVADDLFSRRTLLR